MKESIRVQERVTSLKRVATPSFMTVDFSQTLAMFRSDVLCVTQDVESHCLRTAALKSDSTAEGLKRGNF
jgi:uncharacterized membrane protein